MKKEDLNNFKELQKYIKNEYFYSKEFLNKFLSKNIEEYAENIKKQISSNQKFINYNKDLYITCIDILSGKRRDFSQDYESLENILDIDEIKNYQEFLLEEWFDYCDEKNIIVNKDLYRDLLDINAKEYRKIMEYQNKLSIYIKESIEKLKADILIAKNDLYDLNIEGEDNIINYFKKNISISRIIILNTSYSPEKFIDETVKDFNEKIIYRLQKEIKSSHKNILNSESENYILFNNSSDNIEKFLNKKTNSFDILFDIEAKSSKKYKKIIMFSDKSIAFEKPSGEFLIPEKNDDYKRELKEFYHEYIKHSLRKKPKYMKLFESKLKENNYDIGGFIESAILLMKLDNTLLRKGINPLLFFKDKNYEEMYDYLSNINYEKKVQDFALSIFSNKYKHLIEDNEEAFKYLKELYDINVSKKDLQDNIGSHIAKYKNIDDFNHGLKIYFESLNDFNMKSVLMKSSGLNASVAYENGNDLLILQISDSKSSKNLGSASWCITSSENYSSKYIEHNERIQFFVYDFTKESSNNESMIGITLKNDGTLYTAHIKNNYEIDEDDDLLKKYKSIIISNNLSLFPKISDELKDSLGLGLPDKKRKRAI